MSPASPALLQQPNLPQTQQALPRLCARAKTLVNSARVALQEATVISSRCVFLRNSLKDQLNVAIQINRMMHSTRDTSRAEFEKMLTGLDNADNRLNQTLEVLRNSIVDPAFSIPNPENEDPTSMTKARTLHDFVDDEGIENLKSRLRHSIDQVQESHDTLSMSLAEFDADLTALDTSLSKLPDPSKQEDGLAEPIHPYLHSLEEQAEEMAQLLESLTQHFDRCSQALRDSEAVNTHNQESGMTDELKERLDTMENISTYVGKHIEKLHGLSGKAHDNFLLFEEFQGNLGGYVGTTREFETQQDGYFRAMEERLDELWQLGDFYEGFMGAYDAMVIEVGRRKGVAAGMDNIVKDAMKKLQGLYEADLAEREVFKEEQGDHLPMDIWPGIMDMPIRYSIVKDPQGGSELPNISKEALQRALGRRAAREGM
ncbi:uncharacterized protein LAJ45_02727 [Morchella importuna]|uniref:uncharacterized protein n=1 Tax=Morchella importuna TaxID=1174673 RepID=UPI001E8E0332|nr:uncharacterized protein LAJ45_02727 [Morchella importuna]KAH8153140.1 hypothetical protein LAJ45_02727 [Morchella importuna]